MAADRDSPRDDGGNLLEDVLADVREQYVTEHGEEPPDEFLEDARELVLRNLAKKGREEHRDVYEALAEE